MEIYLGRFEHCSRWRLPAYLLQDPVFVKFVESCIDKYFELNTDETTSSIRWEAFKAYIRGEIISYTSAKTKQYNQELQMLEDQIKKIEIEASIDNNPEKLRNLSIMRANYDKLTTDKVAKSLLWTEQAYYDQGKKAGKLLAWRIKKMQSERTINNIKLKSVFLTTDPAEINNNFRVFFFIKLYINQNITETEMPRNHFLINCNFTQYQKMEK